MKTNTINNFRIEPYEDGSTVLNEIGKELFKRGEESLRDTNNMFGVVLLAGGQGSRLGSDLPKALYKLSGRPLIEYHIETIVRLIKKYKCIVKLFVMVSSFTERDIKDYLTQRDFGVPIEIVKQDDRVCTDSEGRPLRDDTGEIIKAPGGNGDVFRSLKNVNLTDFLCVNILSIDNVLAKILDPVYVGAFVKNQCDVLSKSVKKRVGENVGVFVPYNGSLKVIEYLDLPEDQYSEDGNICNHLFSGIFLREMTNKDLPEHAVLKKIPFFRVGEWVKPTKPNGLKRETFIFDSFEFSKRNLILRVSRESEFSPLKNGKESETDNPTTCEEALRRLIKDI